MDYLTLPLSAVFGLIAPLVISFLASSTWSTQLKLALSGVVSFVFALFAVLMTQGIPSSVEGVFSSAGVVFSVATLYYKAYFENTGLNQQLTSVDFDSRLSLREHLSNNDKVRRIMGVLYKNPAKDDTVIKEVAAEVQVAETEKQTKA